MKVWNNQEIRVLFDFMEKRVFKPKVELPYITPRIKHEPWQVVNFTVAKALEEAVVNIMKRKLEWKALKLYCGPYCNV